MRKSYRRAFLRVRGFCSKNSVSLLDVENASLLPRCVSAAPSRPFPASVGVDRERVETDPLSRTLTAVYVRPLVREFRASHAATSPGCRRVQLLVRLAVKLWPQASRDIWSRQRELIAQCQCAVSQDITPIRRNSRIAGVTACHRKRGWNQLISHPLRKYVDLRVDDVIDK